MTGGVAARPVRAPASARAVGAAVKSNSAFAPRARPAPRRSLRFAVRAGVKGPTFIPDPGGPKEVPKKMPVATGMAAAVMEEPVAEAAAPTNYQNNLKQRILARGPRETFFEEDYNVTIREYVPTQVKVAVECNGPRFRVRVETDSEAELILHWGVATSKAPDTWVMPHKSIMPTGTKELAEVCQTPLIVEELDDGKLAYTVIEGDVEHAPATLNFVLHDPKYNQWYNMANGDAFRIKCPCLPEPEPEPEPEPIVDLTSAVAAAGDAIAAEAKASPAPATPRKPKGMSSLLGTLNSFKRNPASPSAKKAKEEKATKAKGGKKRRGGKKAAAKAKGDESDTDDDDDYEMEESKKSGVAELLMSKAKGKDAAKVPEPVKASEPVIAPEPVKAGPWTPFFDLTERVFTEVDKVTRVGVKVDVEAGMPPGSSARVRVETDLPGDLLLHWGVVPRGARADMWTVPPPPMRPEGTKVYGDRAVQSPLKKVTGGLAGDFAYCEVDLGSAPGGLRFVIKESGGRDRWFDNYGADFVVPLPEQAVSTSLNGNVRNNSQTATASPTKNGPKSMEAAQMALGGAAAATFSGIKSNIDASIEEAIKEAAIAMEAAKIAREVAEQATAAAKDLPEDAGASTKARRLIAQANATAERAAITARRAEAAAIRAKAAKDASFSDLTSTAAAANLIKKAEEVEKMAEETWAGADVEISEDTLKRWRDEMELAVTKEAEARAAEAEAAARELLEQRKVEAEQERIEAQAAIKAAAAAAVEAKAAAEASVARLEAEAAEAAKVAADAQAQAEAALEAEIEQSIQENMSAAVEEGNSKLAEIECELKERMDALEEMKRAAADPTIERSTDKPSWLVDPEATIVMPDPVEISEPPRTFAEPVTPPVSQVVPRVPVAPTPVMPPADPSTRIQTPTGTGEEMLLQGFNWESSRIEGGGAWYRKMTEMAPQMAEMGITVAWLPPPTDSVSQEGYMPRDLYNLNCKYGTKEELKTCIEALHKHGIKCLGDAVLNHRCAQFQGPDGLWNQYGGKLDWDARAIVSDDPHFGGQGNQSQGDFFHAAPNIDHSQDFVKKDITEWMQWMQSEVGYDGWRLDYVRGFSGTHVKTYMESTNVSFAVGEFWDTLEYDYDSPKYNQDAHRQRIIKWIDDAGGLAGAFDVTTKGILHAVFERQEYWRLSDEDGQPPGVLGRWPSRAVTFIENHDTGSTQGHWRFPEGSEAQGYAYIMTHPGTPTVFWDHVYEWHDQNLVNDIKKLIAFRKECGIHCRSSVNILKAEAGVYAAQIDDRVVMKIGPDAFSPDETEWEYATHGDNWCVWRHR